MKTCGSRSGAHRPPGSVTQKRLELRHYRTIVIRPVCSDSWIITEKARRLSLDKIKSWSSSLSVTFEYSEVILIETF